MSGSDRVSEVGQNSSNLTVASKEETFCSGMSQKIVLDNPSNDALTNEAYLFMKKMLPSYIVNCFMATGYDTLDVLAEINDESLAEIQGRIPQGGQVGHGPPKYFPLRRVKQ